MAGSGVGEDVKLLGHWASPFVPRVEIALNFKGVGYELLEVEIGSKGELVKSELLLNSNPVYKKIPVLIHDGKPICESMTIVQYMDEVWAKRGASILPSDPHDRAVARFWSVYIDEWIIKLFVMLRAKTAEQAIFQRRLSRSVAKGRASLEGTISATLTIALGGCLGWIEAAEELCGVEPLDEARTPQLVGWVERFLSDDAVKGVMPKVGKFVEFGNMAQARKNAKG